MKCFVAQVEYIANVHITVQNAAKLGVSKKREVISFKRRAPVHAYWYLHPSVRFPPPRAALLMLSLCLFAIP